MNQQENDFDTFFRNKGGISRDIFSESPYIQELLMYARVKIEVLRKTAERVPPIYVDLIDNQELNAVAARSGDQFYIGINIGTILQSFNVFSRMLASNTILTDIGNATLENPPQKMHDVQLKEPMYPLQSYTRNLIPKDSVRNAAVRMFVKHVLDFLICHEYAHIAYGHVDYYDSEQKIGPVDPLILQSFELHADDFSAFINLMLLYKEEPEKNLIISKELKTYYGTRNTALRMWLFPVYTYFRLFGHINLRHRSTTDTHPSPGSRVVLLLEIIQLFMEYHFGTTDDVITTLCMDVIIEVENAFAQISEQGLDTRGFRASFSHETMTHIQNVSTRGDKLSELLRKYSYIPEV